MAPRFQLLGRLRARKVNRIAGLRQRNTADRCGAELFERKDV